MIAHVPLYHHLELLEPAKWLRSEQHVTGSILVWPKRNSSVIRPGTNRRSPQNRQHEFRKFVTINGCKLKYPVRHCLVIAFERFEDLESVVIKDPKLIVTRTAENLIIVLSKLGLCVICSA